MTYPNSVEITRAILQNPEALPEMLERAADQVESAVAAIDREPLLRWVALDSCDEFLEALDEGVTFASERGSEIAAVYRKQSAALPSLEDARRGIPRFDGPTPTARWFPGQARYFAAFLTRWLMVQQLQPAPPFQHAEKTQLQPPAENPAPVRKFAEATDAVPAAYCESGRPCGPLEGNATAILKAITQRDKVRPEDLKRYHGGRVWVRQITKRRLEAFFRSFKEFHAAEERLKPSEKPDNGG